MPDSERRLRFRRYKIGFFDPDRLSCHRTHTISHNCWGDGVAGTSRRWSSLPRWSIESFILSPSRTFPPSGAATRYNPTALFSLHSLEFGVYDKTDFNFDFGFAMDDIFSGRPRTDNRRQVAVHTRNVARKQGRSSNHSTGRHKLGGTCELEKHGTSTLAGNIQGPKVSMKIELHGGAFSLLGSVDGNKMSGTTEPAGGTWKATRQMQ
jgi:hypothetical protein